MTLADLTMPLAYEQAKQYALVFSAKLAARLMEVQQLHGSPIHRASPALLADGRYLLYGDCLVECVPRGILWGVFSRLDAGRFDEIEVMPVAEAESLLPPDPSPY